MSTPAPRLLPEDVAAIAELIGDAKPATPALLVSFGKSVRDRREHDHSTQAEDWYCLNLSAYMGERMGPVLRRLLDAEARVAELEAAPRTVFRASHDSIVMGLYTTAAEARKHCEAEERRSWLTGTHLAFDWIKDVEDDVAELVVVAGQTEESTTGYVVEALEVSTSYDEEADE